MESFDISLLDGEPAQHRVTLLRTELGEPKVGFIIVGRDSPQFRAVDKKLRIASIKRRASSAAPIDVRTDEGASRFHDLTVENEIAVASAVVVGWFGFTDQGAEATFSASLAQKALEKRDGWRAAVIQALEDEANFLPV